MRAHDGWLLLLPLLMTGCAGRGPSASGVHHGRLAPCPSSPNCVSTQTEDPKKHMEPLTYAGPMEAARERLLRVVRSMPGSRVVEETDTYIHVEFRSRIFRFVDDVEFYLDDEAKCIHFRSASRVGYSDLGVNRKRMERVREAFEGAG